MPASHSAAFPHPPDSGAERILRFSFPVTWSFLSQYPSGLKPEPKPDPQRPPIPEIITKPLFVAPAEIVEIMAPVSVVSTAPIAEPAAPDRWEMVIPKMTRPAATRPVKKLLSEEPAARTRFLDTPPATEPVSDRLPNVDGNRGGSDAVDMRPPAFGSITQQPARAVSLPVMIGIALTILLAAGLLVFTPSKSSAVVPEIVVEAGTALPMGPARWVPLTAWPRQVSLVRGSDKLSDFRMDLQGQIRPQPLGWIFRATDSKNFYAMKLEVVKPGPGASLVLKRFAVIAGQDQPVMQIPLALPVRPGAIYKIRTEGVGDRFTTWVMDQKIDQWSDTRLAAGGVGLYNERGAQGAWVGDIAVFPLLRKSGLRK
jgi:hypothetical protein